MEVVEAIRAIGESGSLIGIEVAAFNPTKNQQVATKVAELVMAAFQRKYNTLA